MLFDKNELHTIDLLMLEFVEEYIFVLFLSCYSFDMLIAQFPLCAKPPSKEWWSLLPKRILISSKVSKVFRFSVQGSIYFSKKGGQRVLWTNNLWRSNSSSFWNSYIECNVNDIYEIDNTYVCNHWSERCNSISSRVSIRVIWNSSRHSSKS